MTKSIDSIDSNYGFGGTYMGRNVSRISSIHTSINEQLFHSKIKLISDLRGDPNHSFSTPDNGFFGQRKTTDILKINGSNRLSHMQGHPNLKTQGLVSHPKLRIIKVNSKSPTNHNSWLKQKLTENLGISK